MRGAKPSNSERRSDRKHARKAAERKFRIARAGKPSVIGVNKKKQKGQKVKS